MSRFIPSAPARPRTSTVGETVLAADEAMERQEWAAAAKGYLLVRKHLGERTPKPIFAHAAACLHRLGKYAEAEKLAWEGLGADGELIAQKATPLPEAELTRRWTRDAEPVVSIVCTTYNHERYLESALRGFLCQQTNFPFEILIHDDASTDGTQAIIRNWQKKYPSIVRPVLQSENQMSRGVRPAELLWKLARGKYIAPCEGDDFWIAPTKLQKQVDFLEQHEDFSCTAHNHYLYTEADLSVRPWIATCRDVVLTERQLMNITRLLWLPTLMFRRAFSEFPPERSFAATGDFFLTSYLGTFGKCAYFESFLGTTRRQNAFSFWTPMEGEKKNHLRVKTWLAIQRMHENAGRHDVVADLRTKIAENPLSEPLKNELIQQSLALLRLEPATAP